MLAAPSLVRQELGLRAWLASGNCAVNEVERCGCCCPAALRPHRSYKPILVFACGF
jgi:hypothetical protein